MNAFRRKLLLVEPPFSRLFKDTYSLDRYPLGVGYLGAVARRDTDWEVRVYNADFCAQTEPMEVSYLAGEGFRRYLRCLRDPAAPVWNEVRETVAEFAPDVVGISAKSQSFASACAVANLAKQLRRDVLVVMGGAHPSMVGPEVLKCTDVDVCCRGEGEETLVELLGAVEAERPLDGIRGIRCDTVVLSIFTPYPGTEAFELCRAEGLLPDDYDPSLYNHQSPANCFCRNLPPARFRQLVCEIEQMVGRRNPRSRFKRLLSVKTVQRARQLGLRNAFGKLARTFLRR